MILAGDAFAAGADNQDDDATHGAPAWNTLGVPPPPPSPQCSSSACEFWEACCAYKVAYNDAWVGSYDQQKERQLLACLEDVNLKICSAQAMRWTRRQEALAHDLEFWSKCSLTDPCFQSGFLFLTAVFPEHKKSILGTYVQLRKTSRDLRERAQTMLR